MLRPKDACSDRCSSISSIESNDSSAPASISSRSSSASSPPPPAPLTLPPTPPQTPPIPPPRRRPRQDTHVQFSIYDTKRPEPFPTQPYATPKQNPKPRLSIDTKSGQLATGTVEPVLHAVPPLVTNRTRHIPPAVAVRAGRPLIATAQAPIPSRATVASGSPTTPSGQYTAMLDFGHSFNLAKPSGNRQSMPPAPNTKARIFSLPVTKSSEPTSPARYRRTSLVSPTVDGDMSPAGPVGSSINLRTNVCPNPHHRNGYESDENHPPRGRPTAPVYQIPTPSNSPKSRRLSLPRISTDLSPIKPLNIQPVTILEDIPSPKGKVRFADVGLTSADVQSGELTDILDLYLDQIINDAKSRGVMPAGLEEYLKSPTIMDEWKNDLAIVYEDKPARNGNAVRTVSIVRRALRSD